MTATRDVPLALILLAPLLGACGDRDAKQPKAVTTEMSDAPGHRGAGDRGGKQPKAPTTLPVIRFEPPSSTEGFQKHWTVGSRSASFSTKRHEVIVADAASHTIVKLTDLPRDYGSIIATGWEHDTDFFIHFSHGADEGTMVYIDLRRRVVTRIEAWAAW